MATLTGKKIKDSYVELLKLDSSTPNEGATATLKAVETGEGTDTALSLSTAQIASSVDGSAGTPAITRSSDPDTGIFFPAANTIAASTGGTERLRVNNSGILITTTDRSSGAHALGLMLQDTVTGAQTPNFGTRILGSSNGGSAYSAIGFETGGAGTNNETQIAFYTQNTATPYTSIPRRVTIDSNGQVGIGLIPTSRNNTRLQIVDGIGFPSTQVASSDANTLDDYEEGTAGISITPGGGSLGTTTIAARYTKIGRVVTVLADITVGTVSSPTGSLKITSLPFVAAAAPTLRGAQAIISRNGFNISSLGTGQLFASIEPNASEADIFFMLANGNVRTEDLAPFVNSAATFNLSFTYFTS